MECDNQVNEAIRNLKPDRVRYPGPDALNEKGKFSAEDQYDMYALYMDLKTAIFPHNPIRMCLCTLKNTDTVVSTSGNNVAGALLPPLL